MSIHTTPRLYNADSLSQGASIELGDEQAHYLLHVMRQKDGDIIRLFNAKDGEWQGVFGKSGKRGVIIRLEKQRREPKPERDLWLCPSPIKKAHFDYMIEKATELGVSRIQPILTARTQLREVNGERCRAIATESAEQSERLSVPDIAAPQTLTALLAEWPKDRLLIVCAEWGEADTIRASLARQTTTESTKAAILTGPEGGLTAEELDAIRRLPQALFVRLGQRILRADTAAIAALSVWQAICGDWTSSKSPDN